MIRFVCVNPTTHEARVCQVPLTLAGTPNQNVLRALVRTWLIPERYIESGIHRVNPTPLRGWPARYGWSASPPDITPLLSCIPGIRERQITAGHVDEW